VLPPLDVDIKFLFDMVTAEYGLNFQIDCLTKSSTRPCLTPRRNRNTDDAYAFFAALYTWYVASMAWRLVIPSFSFFLSFFCFLFVFIRVDCRWFIFINQKSGVFFFVFVLCLCFAFVSVLTVRSKAIIDYFVLSVFPLQNKGWPRKDGYQPDNIFNDYGVFVPVVPLFEKEEKAEVEAEEEEGFGVEKLPKTTGSTTTTTTASLSATTATTASSSTTTIQPATSPSTTTASTTASSTATVTPVKESASVSSHVLSALGKGTKEKEC
jgi:hypothetical protein